MRKLGRILIVMSLVAMTVLGASAQDDSSDDESEGELAYDPSRIAWTCPEGFEGQTLNVFNWATYIGSNTIATFEALCDVTVIYDVYDNNEAMVARLRNGNPGYDIAFPTEYIIPVMIREDLIAPIDAEKIPNLANIAPRWRGMFFDPNDEYTVPYMWGTTGIAYNTERVTEVPDSWMDIFEHDGPVAWLGDPRTMLSVALNVLGFDPNSTDAEEVEQARDFLVANAGNLIAAALDDGQALLERGEVDMTVEYDGDIYQLINDCACETYGYVLPQEGAILNIAAMVLLKDGPNPDLAMAFMDYVLDPYVNGQITNEITYPTANQAAIDGGFVDEALLNSPIYPDLDTIPESYFLEYIGDADVFYNNAWDEALILIGK